MQNAFGTFVAIGIVAGGFLLTGDLGWCARRISQVFDPTAAPAAEEPAAPAAPPVAGTETARAVQVEDAAAPWPAAPAPALRRPPAAGLDLVALTRVSPGQQVVVWTKARGRAAECHVIHVLDAARGEALLQRRGSAGDGPARRVAISTAGAAAASEGEADSGVLRMHGSFQVRPLGLAPGLDGIIETCGPITGLAVE